MTSRRILVISGEASGDMYAARVIQHLLEASPDLEIRAWGGEATAATGVPVLKHFREMAFMGFWEVARNILKIRQNFKEAESEILSFKPDLLLTVDFPGFNLRLARFAHDRGIQTAHYISPAIWAWKAGRIHSIKRDVDQIFVTLPFEKTIYDEAGVPCEFVGHPLTETGTEDGNGETGTEYRDGERAALANRSGGRATLANGNGEPVISSSSSSSSSLLLMPGSREQEVMKMLPIYLKALELLQPCHAVVVAAPGAESSWYDLARTAGVEVVEGPARKWMVESRAGLITSGTATLEAGLAGLPTVIAYRTSAVTYWIARRLAQVSYIGLPNIILNRSVFPERIQSECTPERLAEDLRPLLVVGNSQERSAMVSDLDELRKTLRGGGNSASKKVAEGVLKMLKIWTLLALNVSLFAQQAPVLKVGLNGGEDMSAWSVRAMSEGYAWVNASGEVLKGVEPLIWLSLEASGRALNETTGGNDDYWLMRPTVPGAIFELKRPGAMAALHAGALHIDARQGGEVRLILETSLESYLPGVLSAEAGKGHAPAFYEAQAIVSRTYTVQAHRRHATEGFHVCDRVHCQVYHGLTTVTDTMYDAVANTRHKILINQSGAPITAAFHSNCGGHTQGAEAVWRASLPYLRCVADTFCLKGNHSHWETTVDSKRWGDWLADARGHAEGPTSLLPTERKPHLMDTTVAIRAAAARAAFGLPSAFFVALDNGETVDLIGRGFGHGIGMCQEGAMARAAAGHSSWEILNAYYQQVFLADSRVAWDRLQRLGK